MQRPLSWARTWSDDGHLVSVVTEGDDHGEGDLREGVEVIRIKNPLRRFSSNKISNHPKQDSPSTLQRRLSRLLSWPQNTFGILRSGRMPDPQSIWARRAIESLQGKSWDIVVSTSGPYPVHAVAYALRKSGMCRYWAADFRDLWVDNHIYPGLFPFTIMERWLERRWMTKADKLVTVSEALAATLVKKYGSKVEVSYNGYSEREMQALPNNSAATRKSQTAQIDIVFTGTYYPGLYDIAPFCAGLDKYRKDSSALPLRVTVFGGGDAFADAVSKYACRDLFCFEGMVGRQEALLAQRRASAVLFLGNTGIRGKGVLSGKVFEYLYSGTPILAVGVDADSELGRLLALGRNSYCCGDRAQSVTDALLALSSQIPAAGNPNDSDSPPMAILGFERAAQARRLLNALN